jgi:hypothetical protein
VEAGRAGPDVIADAVCLILEASDRLPVAAASAANADASTTIPYPAMGYPLAIGGHRSSHLMDDDDRAIEILNIGPYGAGGQCGPERPVVAAPDDMGSAGLTNFGP